MRPRIQDKNIWTIYVAILVLGVAYGISISLLAHHLDVRGFTKEQMGSLAAWFALGIVGLSLPMGWLIRKLSAKTTLALSLGGYAAAVTIFPMLTSYPAIVVDRFLDGACSVGIWVSCETILLARSEEGMKAYVTTLYAMAMAIGYVLGPVVAERVVIAFGIPRGFLVSGALASIATLIVVFRLERGEAGAHAGEASSRGKGGKSSWAVLARIKTSCFATFAYGYFQASVVLFLPLYLMEQKGIARTDTILIPFYFALGMLLFSNFAGRLGDRFGHLLLMRVLGAIGMSMVLGFVLLHSYVAMVVAVFIAGATLASISPVSLALQGVVTAKEDYSRSNAIYNAFYAAGMLVGPKVSSILFESMGGGAMLLHLAALWLAFVVFTMIYASDDPAASRQAAVNAAVPNVIA